MHFISKISWFTLIILAFCFLFIDQIYSYGLEHFPLYFKGMYNILHMDLSKNFISMISPYWVSIKIFISSLAIYCALLKIKAKNEIAYLIYKQNKVKDLYKISWQEFEALLKEIFIIEGYKVKNRGGAHADGGVDLEAYKGRKKTIVQCKQWKKSKVGVQIVREMFGVMIHEKANHVYIVTCGDFTKEAFSFAVGKPITLVNGFTLIDWIQNLK